MKEELTGKKKRRAGARRAGFSIVELVMALALLSLVLGGTVLAYGSVQYWGSTAAVSHEALLQSVMAMGTLRARARTDFYTASGTSTRPLNPSSCPGAGCYYVTQAVMDISSCAKYADVGVSWKFGGYPTSTSLVSSFLVHEREDFNQGGDCLLQMPRGSWTHLKQEETAEIPEVPTTMDVLHGTVYGGLQQPPYLFIASSSPIHSFSNGYTNPAMLNALDVVQDAAAVYGYGAAATSSKPFEVIDLTDPTRPTLVAERALHGVTVSSSQAHGWRVFYYDHTVYLTTRFISGSSPELHIFDVRNPEAPVETGWYKLSTSVYSLIARDQIVAGVRHRFLYLATTSDTRELLVLEVTDPAHIRELTGASCALPGTYQALALALSGTTLYLGRDSVPGGEELYAFDVRDPLGATNCLPILAKADSATDFFSRHIQALRVAGPYVFAATSNTTNAHGQIQIRESDPEKGFALIGTYSIPRLIENGIDSDGDFLYALSSTTPRLIKIESAP